MLILGFNLRAICNRKVKQTNLPSPADDVTLVLLVLVQLTLQLHLALVPDQLLFIETLGVAKKKNSVHIHREDTFQRTSEQNNGNWFNVLNRLLKEFSFK